MDDLGLGRAFRELRLRLGWRQRDVAARAGVSDATYSRLERGEIGSLTLRTLRKVAEVLEVRLAIEPRWRGAGLDRLVSRGHGAMTEAVTRLLIEAGWEVRHEVSFNVWGERGVVDICAWQPVLRALLMIELKTEIVDVNGLLTVTNRRRRLALAIVEAFGWRPATISQWVVVADSRTNRRRLAEHRTALRAAFPVDGRGIPGWLRRPAAAVAALWFLPDDHRERRRPRFAGRQRVRTARSRSGGTSQAA